MAEIILIGDRGMLGRAVAEALTKRGLPFRGLGRTHLDIIDPAQVLEHITPGTRLVINCAAYTDVDGAEADEPYALRVNGYGPGFLAERCAEVSAVLVHYGTDYVFDGASSLPYSVDHAIAPINAYGRTKAAGEARIRAQRADHLILRTSWLYAPWSKNFVRTIAKMSRERESLRVVDDQRGRPTSAEQLAETTLNLLDRGARGTFHATDADECTWHGFATEIAAAVNPGCRVAPCSTEEFPRPAPRPRYSVLDISATEALTGPLRSWQDELRSVLRRLDD